MSASERCIEAGCPRERYGRYARCRDHVNASRRANRRGAATERGRRNDDIRAGVRAAKIPEVVAESAFPDSHPKARAGQRIVVYACPACNGRHRVAWGPLDEHPGLKTTTCRGAMGHGVLVFVLAPPPARLYAAEPDATAPPEGSNESKPEGHGPPKAVRVQ